MFLITGINELRQGNYTGLNVRSKLTWAMIILPVIVFYVALITSPNFKQKDPINRWGIIISGIVVSLTFIVFLIAISFLMSEL